MSDINDYFDPVVMKEIRLKSFMSLNCKEDYYYYQIIHEDDSLYNLYMMLEECLNKQRHWLITIPMRHGYVNMRVYDNISLFDIEKQLKGQFSYIGEYEFFKSIIAHLMDTC